MAEFDRDAYVRDQVLELYRWSRDDHERKFSTPAWVWYRHYKNLIDLVIDVEDYHSNMGVGVALPMIETTNAKLMEPWLGGDQIIKAHGRAGQEEPLVARVAAWTNDLLVNRVQNAMANMGLAKKSALIFSRGILKYAMVAPRPRSTVQRVPIRLAGDIFPGGVRVGSYLDNLPAGDKRKFQFRYIDPFMWWMTPGIRFLSDTDWTFEDEYLTTSQCWEHVETGDWKTPPGGIQDDGPGYDEYYRRRMNVHMEALGTPETTSPVRRPHRKTEFQGRIQTKETKGSRPKYENMLVTVLDGEDIVKIDQLTTWDGAPSYICWQPTLDPLSSRAIGMIEPVEYQLLALNDLANIMFDNIRKITESTFLLDPTQTEQSTLYLGPGEVNKVRNPMYAVKALEMKDLPPSAFEFLGWFNDLIQRISGVSDYFGGLNTSDTDKLTKTATGMSLMASLSASRFGPILGSMDRDLYRPLCLAHYMTARQRMDTPDQVRMPGLGDAPYQTIMPEDLEGEMEFSFNVRALDPSSDQRREQFVMMVEKLLELNEGLMQQQKGVDIYEVSRMLMEEFDRGGDVDKVIKDLAQLAGMGMLPAVPMGGPMPGMGNVGNPAAALPAGMPATLPGPSPISPAIPSGIPTRQLAEMNPVG